MQSAQQFWTEAYVSSCRRPCIRSLFYPRRFLSQWKAITKLSQGCSQVSKQDEASLERCNCLVLPHASYGPVSSGIDIGRKPCCSCDVKNCELLRTAGSLLLLLVTAWQFLSRIRVLLQWSIRLPPRRRRYRRKYERKSFSFPPPRNSWRKEKTKLLCSIVQNLIVGQWRTQHLLLRYCEWSWKIRNLAIGRNIGETQRLPDNGSW